ncbi:NAD(P)H-hydrate dehydratase [Virgibacillus sp. FSP13]
MYIVTAKEMYDMDRYTVENMGLDARILMENAGRAVSFELTKVVTKKDRICVIVGGGNNGGDGFVIARTLKNANYHVAVVQVVPDKKITGDVSYNKTLFLNCGGSVVVTTEASDIKEIVINSDVIIDAMIGIGVHDNLKEPVATIVSVINELAPCIISVDIPTGLPADESITSFSSIQADYTIIIEAPKMSLFLQHTASFYGKWKVVSIGIPAAAVEEIPERLIWDQYQFQQTMPKRGVYAHKGEQGKGLAIGGSKEMPGSIAMTAKAALRTGAGLLTVGTSESVIPTIAAICVEATYLALNYNEGSRILDVPIPFDKFHAIVIGMGLGRGKKAERLVQHVLTEANYPVIIDADGLYHAKSECAKLKKRSYPTIMTPHPGEMAMLLDVSVAELLEKPFYYSAKIARDYQVYLVLKGKYTIITAPDGQQAVSITGNQGLAKGGSGDVLSGTILAMVMQHKSIFQALCNACFVHGTAADLLVTDNHSYYDLMATDVIEGIPAVYRTFLDM